MSDLVVLVSVFANNISGCYVTDYQIEKIRRIFIKIGALPYPVFLLHYEKYMDGIEYFKEEIMFMALSLVLVLLLNLLIMSLHKKWT